jgi:hypothetical protein
MSFNKTGCVLICIALSNTSFSTNIHNAFNDSVYTNAYTTHVATFATSKLITLQTTETLKAKTFRFAVTDRFGNMNAKNGGGYHTFYGIDNSADIRFSLDMGITDHLMIGMGRSKQNELLDGFLKYSVLNQDAHIPLSAAIYSDMSYNPQQTNLFYSGMASTSGFKQSNIQRLSYTSQLIIARKFSNVFSMELVPTFQHRNFVIEKVNQTNGAVETNNLFAMGAGFRLKLSTRVSMIADYYYTFSKYRKDNALTPFYAPLAIGVEVEAGKHIFQFSLSNVSGIIENNYLPNTTDGWLKRGIKFGITVSRGFNVK